MSNFSKVSVSDAARTELHDLLGLTGAEVSINSMPAGVGVPFVHYHKKNEEIYTILSGEGRMVIDGETVDLKAGDWMRVAPAAKRQLFADTDLCYVCIQVRENSLEEYTGTDGVIEQ